METIDEQAVARTQEDLSSMDELRYLEQFEHLIIMLSGRFVNVASSDLDAEIDHALQAIGSFAEVERSYVFQFSADRTRFTNTHEWCAPGVEPMIDRLQDAPADQFHWALQHFLRGEALYVEDVEKLPPEAVDVKQELIIQGIRSLVNVPLVCDGSVMGFVGFDALRRPKVWTIKHQNLLKVVGEIIAGAIDRERKTAALSHQVLLEKLVADISTHFINIPILHLDDEISESIKRIGEFIGVDRSYVFRVSDDNTCISNTHEWCAEGIESYIDRLQELPVAEFGYSMQTLGRGEVFHVPDVAQLPSEADHERREFEREGIKTLVNVPIMARQRMIGFLGFDAVQAHKSWSEQDIRLLKLIGEIIANALDRKAIEERLQGSLNDKEVLLREIHHRVKNNMQIVNSLLFLQERAVHDRVDSVALDAFRHSRARIKAMAVIHDRLYRSSEFSSIDFEEYLKALVPELLDSYGIEGEIKIEIAAQDIRLGLDAAIPCALIINELITNSLKHAFMPGKPGKIELQMGRRPEGSLRVVVADNGVGMPASHDLSIAPKTLGLRLVTDLAKQLDGS
ncbi:MAG: GAF domain-containing protein, partial [Gammaproteobacteria bacterium]|nr:GAF domain-containing protein [Gammaproteobacteria bacterium]